MLGILLTEEMKCSKMHYSMFDFCKKHPVVNTGEINKHSIKYTSDVNLTLISNNINQTKSTSTDKKMSTIIIVIFSFP